MRLFSFAMLMLIAATTSIPVKSDDAAFYEGQVRELAQRILSAEERDLSSVRARLATDDSTDERQRVENACALAVYAITYFDVPRLPLVERCREAAERAGDDRSLRLAKIMSNGPERYTALPGKRIAVDEVLGSPINRDDIRELAVYVTLDEINESLVVAELEVLLRRADASGSEEALSTRYLILWKLANLDKDLSSRLVALEHLLTLAQNHGLPLRRYVLLYNLIRDLNQLNTYPGVCQGAVDVYLAQTRHEANLLEERWALHVALECAHRNPRVSAEAVMKRANAVNSHPLSLPEGGNWLGGDAIMTAETLLRLGEVEKAQPFIATARRLFKADEHITHTRSNFSVANSKILEGQSLAGIEQLHRTFSQFDRNEVSPRQEFFRRARELVEAESEARRKAQKVVARLQRSNSMTLLAIGFLGVFLFYLWYLSKALRAA